MPPCIVENQTLEHVDQSRGHIALKVRVVMKRGLNENNMNYVTHDIEDTVN